MDLDPSPYPAFNTAFDNHVTDAFWWKGKTYKIVLRRVDPDIHNGFHWLVLMADSEILPLDKDHDFHLVRIPWQRGSFQDLTFGDYLARIQDEHE